MHTLKNILLIEDNPGDIRLVEEALRENKLTVNLEVVGDGVEALAFLNKEGKYSETPLPDLILLDLNMPRMDGRETLENIKNDPRFKRIPTVVLTTSSSKEDIQKSYKNSANAYITKPVDFDQFINMIQQIKEFWLTIIKLPPNS